MDGVRLILTLHNHQPVGNFDSVFEKAYRDSYLPFLEVLEDYPALPFALHTSGPLLEWLVERHPEYVARLRAMVAAGRVEILGGGFFEPIMTMIPHRDRVGQIRSYSDYLHEQFGVKIRGMWMPERVWEQQLVSSLADTGIEYTILDDFHFRCAGLTEEKLLGYYLTEDDGRLVKVFPGSERLRYLMPYQEPHATYEYLRQIAERFPGSTVVFADDGEKFGSWPETHKHVYINGWLRRFCDMLMGNRDWLHMTTFTHAVDQTLPRGKVYLPDSSYREMTEWVLSTEQFETYDRATKGIQGNPAAESLRPFVRAGGFWRNFKVKYPETDEMYARMLGLSQRLADVRIEQADPDYVEVARDELYRGQCNCPYWHGAFGGLYLPHLRNAIYRHLIAAHNALDAAEEIDGPRVHLEAGDFNFDARKEVRLENEHLVAFVRPARGGHVYELDAREARINLLATLERRPEPYHRAIAAAAGRAASGAGSADAPERVRIKQKGLERLLQYDHLPRKALVDHIYPTDVTLDDLIACRDIERGDFATGSYISEVERHADQVVLVMSRPGSAGDCMIHVKKTIRLAAGRSALEVHYEIEDLPADRPIHFAVEINLAGMAGHADDRYYTDSQGHRLGLLDARLDLADQEGLSLTDGWLDLVAGLSWSRPAGVWCFPIETVSQSEGGYEGVYQSSAVIPHWIIRGDAHRRWDVRLVWSLSRARVEIPTAPAHRPETARVEA